MLTRIGLLFSLTLVIRLTAPWFTLFGHELSGRDLILILGGLFLLAKSTYRDPRQAGRRGGTRLAAAWHSSFTTVVVQIMLLDIVFSLDSVITAVGMVDQLWVMITAVIVSVALMMVSAETISSFVHRHPTVKMLALSFLLLIGMSLLLEGFDQHIPKGYIYFAMGFSVFVEMINLRLRRRVEPVHLKERYMQRDRIRIDNPYAATKNGGMPALSQCVLMLAGVAACPSDSSTSRHAQAAAEPVRRDVRARTRVRHPKPDLHRLRGDARRPRPRRRRARRRAARRSEHASPRVRPSPGARCGGTCR